jgi:hypothetical protein
MTEQGRSTRRQPFQTGSPPNSCRSVWGGCTSHTCTACLHSSPHGARHGKRDQKVAYKSGHRISGHGNWVPQNGPKHPRTQPQSKLLGHYSLPCAMGKRRAWADPPARGNEHCALLLPAPDQHHSGGSLRTGSFAPATFWCTTHETGPWGRHCVGVCRRRAA